MKFKIVNTLPSNIGEKITIEGGEYSEYYRISAREWRVKMSHGLEYVLHPESLEKLYQKYLKEKQSE